MTAPLKKPHNVLAFDLAGRTGWAVGLPSEIPQCGWADIGDEDDGRSYVALERLCLRLIAEFKPTAIAIEAPFMATQNSNFSTIERLHGYKAIVAKIASTYRFPFKPIPVNAVRVAFVGRAPPKDVAKRMVLAQCRKCGVAVDDHNAADAVAAWFYAQKVHWRSAHAVKIDRQRSLDLFGAQTKPA